MNEVSKDIKRLEFEIIYLKTQTAQNIIEIGKRLIEVKNQLPHGQWIEWLGGNVGFTERSAQRFIQIASDPNTKSISYLGVTKVFDLLSMPLEERQEFIENNNVDEMTTRELREEIQKRKQLEIQNHALQETLAHVQSSKPEVIEKEVVKEVIPDDYEELKRKYESKSLLEKQIKLLEEEIYKKDTKILSLQNAQRETLNKLPQTDKEKKLLDDSMSFIWAVNDFLKKVGGLVYLTQQISDLPTHERNRYISAIENVWGWSNQTKFNLEEVIKNE